SGTTTAVENGAAGAVTATLTLQTQGSGAASLATDITGVTLTTNADYSANTQSFAAGASDGATVSLTVTATNDQLVEGPESFTATLVDTTSNASVSETGSATVSITDNDSATVTLSGTTTAVENGAAGAVTATLTLQTQGSGSASLATDITGVTLATNADYSANTQSFAAGASDGATVGLSVTAVNDQLVEGPESFSASLADIANVIEAGSAPVSITDNDTATVTLSGTTTTDENGSAGAVTVTLSLQTQGTGGAALGTNITGITLASNADYTASTQSFGSGASDGATVSVSVTAVNDQLVEGPESFSASLVDTTSNANISETGSATVSITDND